MPRSSRVYELTVVFPVDESKDKLVERVVKLAAKAKVEVAKQEEWGQKRLAYLVQKHLDGFYMHYVITGSVKAVGALDKSLRLENGILRYLLIATDG